MKKNTKNSLKSRLSRRFVLKSLAVAALAFGFAFQNLPANAQENGSDNGKTLKVAGVFQTPIEEPWDHQVHVALLKASKNMNIDYQWSENVKAADFSRVMREYAEKGYDLIVGDAFGQERAARRVAGRYPDIPFVFGSGRGPAKPNFSVIDDWIQQPAYLAGMIAGRMTKTDKIGAVAALPIPEVNRLVNAFYAGARDVNKNVQVKTSFIGSFFDPAKAKEAALAQIDDGVDVVYAERLGVIQAAKDKGVMAISNMSDQHKLAPDTVITGPVWDMYPTIKHVIKTVRSGRYKAENLRPYSLMDKGGSRLAPYHQWASKLPDSVKKMVEKRKKQILSGDFEVGVEETNPKK